MRCRKECAKEGVEIKMSGEWRMNGRCTERQRWTIELRVVDAKAIANDAFACGRVPGDPGSWAAGLRYSWGDNALCYCTAAGRGRLGCDEEE